ncbi:MAG TPA: YbhB/YbcL family Raf kinase inhibitor-like protein [Solirubrobacteraceae bacterium]|nr:YbhB/YbcL family Raf kinase inhibitor-like protein [Solirubrobacteraceae bacterium]
MSAHYTCDGANVPPPISWSHVPPNTAEIDLFLFDLSPVHGKLFASWAVAGISPKLRGLSAGQLPAGAILGRNSHGQTGYSLCPPKGPAVRYAFLMYALPKKIPVSPGFDAEKLREKALHVAASAGLLGASYKHA